MCELILKEEEEKFAAPTSSNLTRLYDVDSSHIVFMFEILFSIFSIIKA